MSTLLNNTVKEIIEACNTNGISIFHGDFDSKSYPVVSWDISDEKDWVKFLDIAKKINANVIVIDVIYNKVSENDKEIEKYKEELDEDDLKDFNNSLKLVSKHKDEVVMFSLFFSNNGVIYNYTQSASWLDEYKIVYEAYTFEFSNEDDEEVKEKNILSDTDIEKIANSITLSEEFFNASNSGERHEIVSKYLENENVAEWYNIHSIRSMVNKLYEKNVRPKQEDLLRSKIQELKKKGLPKVQIQSQQKNFCKYA